MTHEEGRALPQKGERKVPQATPSRKSLFSLATPPPNTTRINKSYVLKKKKTTRIKCRPTAAESV